MSKLLVHVQREKMQDSLEASFRRKRGDSFFVAAIKKERKSQGKRGRGLEVLFSCWRKKKGKGQN